MMIETTTTVEHTGTLDELPMIPADFMNLCGMRKTKMLLGKGSGHQRYFGRPGSWQLQQRVFRTPGFVQSPTKRSQIRSLYVSLQKPQRNRHAQEKGSMTKENSTTQAAYGEKFDM